MSSRRRIVAVVATLACLAAPAGASAAVRYASPTGSGTACTQLNPCDIAEATRSFGAGQVNPGDVIVIGSGTYQNVPEIDILDANVDLHGEAGQPRPTLVSIGNAAVFSNESNVSISHLNIQHTGANATVGGISVSAGSGAGSGTIDDVVIHSDASAFNAGGGTYSLRNCVCWSAGDGDAGVNAINGTTLTMRNVTAIGTGSVNSHGLRVSGGTGTASSVTGTNVIAHTTSADSSSDDVHANAFGAGSAGTATLDHSNYSNVFQFASPPATATVTPPGTNNNQTAPPVFVDAATGGFHQAGSSPTVNAGVTAGGNGTVDIDGETRANGTTDIGADEFVDGDADGVADVVDNCPVDANADQANNDGDTQGDACDPDDDNDTVIDATDNCALTANADQANNDGDAQGDVCDPDDDNDTVNDASDNCALTANADQANNDGDTQGDACDADDDNDGVDDGADACPTQAGPSSNGGCPESDIKDTTAPETTISAHPAKRVFKRKTAFDLSSDDATAHFECSLDGAAFSPCGSSVQFRVKYGKHTFAARAVDPAGNADATPASWTWKVKHRR
jgi:hypothetical protein